MANGPEAIQRELDRMIDNDLSYWQEQRGLHEMASDSDDLDGDVELPLS